MEWLQVIVTAVCSLLAAVGGGSIIYFKQNRAMKEVEVEIKKQESESNEIAQWKELYQEVKVENRRLSDKIDELYKNQHELTNEMVSLRATLKEFSCTRKACKDRIGIDCPVAVRTRTKEKSKKEVTHDNC